MIKLNGLEKNLVDFSGVPMKHEITGKFVVMKDILLQCVGTFATRDGQEATMTIAVGQKIYNAKDGKVELEDAEYSLLEKMIENPSQPQQAIVFAQLIKFIQKVKEE